MKQVGHRIIVALLIGVFVNFVFSNTVFLHSHISDDGRKISHSHPYIPTSGHTHAAVSLDQIAAFNISASTIDCPGQCQLSSVPDAIQFFFGHQNTPITSQDAESAALRGPPAA